MRIGPHVLFSRGEPHDELAPQAAEYLQGKELEIEVNVGAGGTGTCICGAGAGAGGGGTGAGGWDCAWAAGDAVCVIVRGMNSPMSSRRFSTFFSFWIR